jgi:hypothetical protein
MSLRPRISKEFSCDMSAAGLDTTIWKPLFQTRAKKNLLLAELTCNANMEAEAGDCKFVAWAT